MLKNKRIYLVPIVGFAIIIMIGGILLSLPISNNKQIEFIDALFTSASGVCVTGSSTVNIVEQFNIIGQIILAILMQIGALGFMIFIVFVSVLTNKKISLSETMIISESINNNDYTKMKEKSLEILRYTFMIELIGAIFLSFKFVPMLGWAKGIWYSIFHAIAAFCNDGFDLFGNTSLVIFKDDVFVNIVLILLMFLGGIGFFVIEDIINCIKKKNLKKLKFHSKIVLSATMIVTVISTILIYLLEPNMNIMQSLFATVTLRTTGLYTVSFSNFNEVTKMLAMLIMFIGGAPGSTSGGIRIVVFAILVLTTISTLKNKKDVVVFYKKIDEENIKKSVMILMLSLMIIFASVMLFVAFDNFGLLEILFHCISSFSTVGADLISLSELNIFGKILTMILIFIGRVGPVASIALLLVDKKEKGDIEYVKGNVIL